MRMEQEVTIAVLGRICDALNCNYGDIMEYIHSDSDACINK
ncbi:MAG: helix-turn-helix transcriptional regulator [Lachnospiraceae bacterium]|nr:helix-turn-helix transcriptional regulator [Lachnospiraceae bacterium]